MKYSLSTANNQLYGEQPYIELSDIDNLDTDILQTDINCFSLEYICQIVDELLEVKSGERERVDFGFEVALVHVLKEGYEAPNGNSYPDGKVRISHSYGEVVIETDLTIDDILKMMTDYRDYVDAWEKETGKIKTGG